MRGGFGKGRGFGEGRGFGRRNMESDFGRGMGKMQGMGFGLRRLLEIDPKSLTPEEKEYYKNRLLELKELIESKLKELV